VWISLLPSISYGADGEGRTSTVSATSGQNPVTATSYNVAHQVTGVTFGSADSDAYQYDGNTGRMTQYKFNINGQADTGVLTWNANSTLQKLVITDAFNSSDSQTCKYGDPSASPAVAGYDDMARLISANCGTAAAQTFSYDPFGNIDKSGSPYSFLPSYSSSTNRITTVGGVTATYYNNGNVTYDGTHHYTWDAIGNSVSVDGVSVTYDALNRAVEENNSGTYTSFVYSPSGAKVALMNGQTLKQAFVALPGKAVAVYTGTGLDHYRHSDWLGSSRLTSSPSRTVLSTVAYAPFGETYAQSGTPDASFTGMDSDITSGDYDFQYREYSSQGRWPSPDPAGKKSANLRNPQSWNRYAYVLNNPLGFTDPLGLECVWDNGSFDSESDPETGTGSGFACQNLGGTWIELGQDDNWNADSDPQLAAVAESIQNGKFNVVTAIGLDGSVYVTAYDGQGRVSWTDFNQVVTRYAYTDPDSRIAAWAGAYSDEGGMVAQAISNYVRSGSSQWFYGPMNPDDARILEVARYLSLLDIKGPCDGISVAQGASSVAEKVFPEIAVEGIEKLYNYANSYWSCRK